MLHKIHIRVDAPSTRQIDRAALRAAARAALQHQAAPPGELTILITNNAVLQFLNRTHLGHNRPTDVLSFPSGEIDPDTGQCYLGDIAISLPRAQAQAKTHRHTLPAELQLLIVHGVLHLLGHDHAKRTDKARMWKAQAEIRKALDQ